MGFLEKLGFNGVGALFGFLSGIIHSYIAAAEVEHGAGAGDTKKAQVLAKVETALSSMPMIVDAVKATGGTLADAAHAGDLQTVITAAGDMVNMTVSVLNAAGALPKAGVVQNADSPEAAALKAHADAATYHDRVAAENAVAVGSA